MSTILFSSIITIIVAIAELYVYIHFDTATKYKIYRLHFVAVLNIVFWYGSKFIWKRLTNEFSNILFHPILNFIWKFFVLLYLILAHSAYLTNYLCEKEASWIGLAAWTSFGSYIILFTLLFSLFLCSLLLLKFRQRPLPRILRAHYRSGISVLLTFLYTVQAFKTARQPPVLFREVIPIDHLPQSMNGTRIVLLADIHLGPTVGNFELKRLIKKSNELKPDIVIMAGDLVDGVLEDLREAAEPVGDLIAPHGLFFSTGNHEYYTGDVENWLQFLKGKGFTVLHNSNKKVHSWRSDNEDDWICILGTDDIQADQVSYTGHGMDLAKAYEGCDKNHPAILSAHQPKAAKMALDSEYPIQLVLSGHTHGGQMHPIIWLCYLVNPFMQGLYQYKGQHVYVTQGSVFFAFPMRFGTVPEITELTLITA